MSKKAVIKVESRDLGKTQLKNLRNESKVPVVIYGHGEENKNLSVKHNELLKVYRSAGSNTIVDLDIDGKITPILIKHIDFHPVRGEIQHADLYVINMKEEVETPVEIVAIGNSDAIKIHNGILIHNKDSVTIRCLPKDLIHNIEVDISAIKEIGDGIHVKDIKISDKIKIMDDPEDLIVSVIQPRGAEEETVTEVTASEGESTEEKKEG